MSADIAIHIRAVDHVQRILLEPPACVRIQIPERREVIARERVKVVAGEELGDVRWTCEGEGVAVGGVLVGS